MSSARNWFQCTEIGTLCIAGRVLPPLKGTSHYNVKLKRKQSTHLKRSNSMKFRNTYPLLTHLRTFWDTVTGLCLTRAKFLLRLEKSSVKKDNTMVIETEDEAVETLTSIEAVHTEGANWQLHLNKRTH